jgi:hypothetical protein
MGRIQQCVRDVLYIANKSEDFGQARKRIEQLFDVSKAQHRGHLAVAQRVRDQINQAYDDVPPKMAKDVFRRAWTTQMLASVVAVSAASKATASRPDI